jgi:DNA-binding MarR family transcriptional regulator
MPLERPLGYWLKLVDGLISQQFEAIVEEHGVTRRQWQVLNLLADAAHRQQELAEALKPFVEGGEEPLEAEVEELVGSGWVEDDGGLLRITERGRVSLRTIGEIVARNRDQISQGIPEEEYATTVDVLQRMARNLGWDDAVS